VGRQRAGELNTGLATCSVQSGSTADPNRSVTMSFLLFLVFVGPYLALAVLDYLALRKSRPL
jgi:hypothetical protein